MNNTLKKAVETKKIAGAYLIEGDSKKSIKYTADEFLLSVFCREGTGCKICSGCKKYLNNNHVDVFALEKIEKTIKVEEVRQIPEFVYQKSFEEGYKAVVILEADFLTEGAQNALLKVIEEPPQNTVFVLGCTNINSVLPTIISRCIRIKKEKLVADINEVINKYQLDKTQATVVIKSAKEDANTLESLMESDFFAMRENVFLVMQKLFDAKNMATSVIIDNIFTYESQLKDYFKLINMCLCDIILYKNTKSFENIINIDKKEYISHYSSLSNYVLTAIFERFEKLTKDRELCAGLNVKLAVEAMLFEILKKVLEGKHAK